ncbi:hypothetical protein G6F22_019356 [Rhizopus arrhizus]|nr:hypothetical protein G6F22_019356 [Rhizopus arrhizus]
MIEFRDRPDVQHAAAGAGLGVVGAEHDARQPRVQHGADAHDARLQRDIHGNARQPVVLQLAGGAAQGHDFGMGGGIVVDDGAVVAAPQDLALGGHDQRPDGHLANVISGLGLFERQANVAGVFFGPGRHRRRGPSSSHW